ncbi:hypothetical protein [Sphingomonas sp. So64.6b]|nr:hypothetical protein [Sphingomonas sp. So64.6b]
MDDLGDLFVNHLGRFFVTDNELKKKGFKVLGVGGPERALNLLQAAIE